MPAGARPAPSRPPGPAPVPGPCELPAWRRGGLKPRSAAAHAEVTPLSSWSPGEILVITGPQAGGSFVPRGHLATSRHIFGGHCWEGGGSTDTSWVEARHGAKRPTMCRTACSTRNYRAPNVSSAEAEKPRAESRDTKSSGPGPGPREAGHPHRGAQASPADRVLLCNCQGPGASLDATQEKADTVTAACDSRSTMKKWVKGGAPRGRRGRGASGQADAQRCCLSLARRRNPGRQRRGGGRPAQSLCKGVVAATDPEAHVGGDTLPGRWEGSQTGSKGMKWEETVGGI